jgi:exonuclease VII small subunit
MRRPGLGLTIAAVFALVTAACNGTAATSTSTAATTTTTADRRTAELEAEVARLTSDLDAAQAAVTRALALRDLVSQQLASAQQQVADLQARQDGFFTEIQDQANYYVTQLESLRRMVPLPDTPQARAAIATLEDFLTAERSGDYGTAASLYGGEYAVLVDWNPDVDPTDHVALLQAGCENQLRCELVVSRVLAGAAQDDGFEFYLEFDTPDGLPWVMEPCCGSDTDPTVSQFPFSVAVTPQGPRVLTLPLYVP